MSKKRKFVQIALIAPVAIAALLTGACMAMMNGTPKPPVSEFGYGPRQTSNGSYSVVIEEAARFNKGKLLSTVIRVQDGSGRAVNDADITVDGGMPQHGHGLPTRPRVTKQLGEGRYQVDGLKFNMGGWWEVKFAIAGAAGADSVTFNVDL